MRHNRHIVELAAVFSGAGIRHVVICPGSRNAPLIQHFTSREEFTCHSIVDERSAGYVALGMARESDRPVAVVTTSGTAVLNLAPSVAEAYHQGIPLVLLTADRPLERFPSFNNQWIDQEAPFYNHSKGFLQLPPEIRHSEDLPPMVRSLEGLLAEATAYPAGPVHINALLEEPLYEPLPESKGKPARGHGPEGGEQAAADALPEPGERVVLLAGMASPGKVPAETVASIARKRGAVIIGENTANLPGDAVIRNPELCLRAAGEDLLGHMEPELVLAVGGQVVSKRLKLFLQSLHGVTYRHLGNRANAFLEAWAARMRAGAEKPGENEAHALFHEAWRTADRNGTRSAFGRLQDLPFGNLWTVAHVLESAPEGSVIHLGNSATIRYSHLVPYRKDLSYYSNRGTSGIDGCVSSAAGAAMVSDRQHLLLLGDLGFVYDSNALWNKDWPSNLRVVVLNDGGGGIFRLLDGPSKMAFYEEFAVTHHPVSLELLGQAFGRRVRRAGSAEEVRASMESFFRSGSPVQVLEVDTAGSENSRIFRQFLFDTESESK